MKKTKTIYWVTTGLFSALIAMSAVQYFTSPEMAETFKHHGFPDFFRIELGVAKILGVIALSLPIISSRVKEWAYAGFGIVLISASITHFSVGDPAASIITPILFLGILATSNIYYYKLKNNNE